eukprot:1444892-Pyramimonas_sp.AAC.1
MLNAYFPKAYGFPVTRGGEFRETVASTRGVYGSWETLGSPQTTYAPNRIHEHSPSVRETSRVIRTFAQRVLLKPTPIH